MQCVEDEPKHMLSGYNSIFFFFLKVNYAESDQAATCCEGFAAEMRREDKTVSQ